MTAFVRPCSTTTVSGTFASHVARGSVNPGVDYACPYGSPVYAAEAGTVVIADGDPDGAGGRVVAIDFDNGYGCDMLHLSTVTVSHGQRVSQGQQVGRSGGSAFGSNFGRPPHLHFSFRHNHTHLGNVNNLDFDAFYRTQTALAALDIQPITEGTTMDYRQIKTLGNPATFSDTTGLVVTHGLTAAQASVRRNGRDMKYIQRKVGESSKAWETRKAAILAYWDVEAAANVAAVTG